MKAHSNLNNFVQSNDQMKRLDYLQRQIKDELDVVPVKEGTVEYFDPFAPVQESIVSIDSKVTGGSKRSQSKNKKGAKKQSKKETNVS